MMKKTFNLGLIGYPLGHSFSPVIHSAALQACGLKGEYSLYPIPPDDWQGLKEILARLRSEEITGLNVTIPNKQNVIPLLDELTPTAKAVGAVNTISMRNGKLAGDNTDAPGFLVDLKKILTTKTQRHEATKSALILGAGGAARAVVYALAHDGWTVAVTARHIEQAQELTAQFPNHDSQLSISEYQKTSFNSLLSNLSLIVNTTPVGMSPKVDVSPWPADLPFPSNAIVYDLVYNPRETKLVREARAARLLAVTGLGMLIEQAALAFEIWTGCKVPRESLCPAMEEIWAYDF
jgi:shikimate dehydrogenase